MPYVETFGSFAPGIYPFLVIPGLSQTTMNWRVLARALEWPTILFDPRGQGKTPMGRRPYQLADHVQDALDALTQVQITCCHLVGFSHGGRVAMHFAANHPEKVASVTLVSTAAHLSQTREIHLLAWQRCLELAGVEGLAWCALPTIIGPSLMAKYLHQPELLVRGMMHRNSAQGLMATLEGMTSYPDPQKDLTNLHSPALVLQGRKDVLVDEQDFHLLTTLPSNARGVWFDQAGHTLALEFPEAFKRQLLDFALGTTLGGTL